MTDVNYEKSPQYLAAVMQWYIENGVDEAVMDAPQNRLAEKQTAPVPVAVVSAPIAAPSIDLNSVKTLDELRAAIINFDGIAIRKTAMNMVFSDGNPAARVMVIGDVPESDEDRAGKPFMGEQGILLDKMFAAIGLSRGAKEPEKAIYLTNLLNWRPPGNRSPQQTEIDLSLPFLQKHIELIKPQIIVLMGALVTKTLLNGTITKLRGGEVDYNGIKCFVTHPPSTLLKTPLKKREAWEDLLLINSIINKSMKEDN